MKKIYLLLGTIMIGSLAFSQSIPQGNPPGNNVNAQANAAWYRGGNNFGGPAGGANIFGTLWNSPIYTQTFGVNRTKLNGNVSYTVNGFNAIRNGFYLLGQDATVSSNGGSLYSTKGAFSQFHIHGSGIVQEFGFRPWMKTGITLTDNNDMSYIGLRQLGGGIDVTEMVINWTDNAAGLPYGPDDMVFRFTSGGSGNPAISNNRILSDDLDGLHIARYSPDGRYALGNTFGINVGTTQYVRPQSLFHMSYDFRTGATNDAFGFMQITYRNDAANIPGTGETANDGLRLGIDNVVNTIDGIQHLNGYLRWQENTPFIVQTDWDNAAGNTINGERMRVSSIGAPGVVDPVPAPTQNITRVAISHRGDQPITNPRSLLHLGYNTSTSPIGGAQLDDGWRNWMDVGTFTNNGSDNMYVGLKNEGTDRQDAVVSWGDNQVAGTNPNGPDKLRFIFTSTTTALPPGQGNSVSQSNDGLEVGRFFPAKDTVFTYNVANQNIPTAPTEYYGRFGVGDFTVQGVNEEPTHKLDVVGNGRFRFLPDSTYIADSTVNKIVMVDSMGVLRWSSFVPTNFGVECADSVNGKLQFDTKVDLNNHNLYFTNNDSLGVNHVGVGYDCSNQLPAKLSVKQTHPSTVSKSTIAVSGINEDVANVTDQVFIGAEGQSVGMQTLPKTINMGGYFVGANSNDSYGLLAEVPATSQNTLYAVGGKFSITSNAYEGRGIDCFVNSTGGQNYGVFSRVSGGVFNFGGDFVASGNNSNYNIGVSGTANGSSIVNYGSHFSVTSTLGAVNIAMAANTNSLWPISIPSDVSIAVYGNAGLSATGVPNAHYAGYFDGNVFINGPANGTGFATTTSDEQFKTDVDTLSSVSDLIAQLKPRTFFYDTTNAYGLNFSSTKQYGLIAQDVELVIPELVSEAYKPVGVDSLGNVVTQAINYKTLNYNAFIAILLKAHQEQQTQLEAAENHSDSLENVVADLNNRLTQLENCLSGILPFLCQMNNSAIAPTQEEVQRELAKAIDIELSDKNNIILNQNVPNPFAEKTVISYSIPESVGKAQIHFYDGKGTLINTVDIVERGSGEINVYANDLSSGVYTYSLVADGQIVSTKRMVKH